MCLSLLLCDIRKDYVNIIGSIEKKNFVHTGPFEVKTLKKLSPRVPFRVIISYILAYIPFHAEMGEMTICEKLCSITDFFFLQCI